MDKWEKFTREMIDFIADLDANKVQFLSYAMTYAQHILVNLDEGKTMGLEPEDATKTQMLYVISNLEGADESDLRKIEEMCKEIGVDVFEATQEMVDLSD